MIFQDRENKDPQNLWGTLVSREGMMRREYGAEFSSLNLMFTSVHLLRLLAQSASDDILDLQITEKLKPPSVAMRALLKK